MNKDTKGIWIKLVANWLVKTTNVDYDNALQDSKELFKTNKDEFLETLKEIENEIYQCN